MKLVRPATGWWRRTSPRRGEGRRVAQDWRRTEQTVQGRQPPGIHAGVGAFLASPRLPGNAIHPPHARPACYFLIYMELGDLPQRHPPGYPLIRLFRHGHHFRQRSGCSPEPRACVLQRDRPPDGCSAQNDPPCAPNVTSPPLRIKSDVAGAPPVPVLLLPHRAGPIRRASREVSFSRTGATRHDNDAVVLVIQPAYTCPGCGIHLRQALHAQLRLPRPSPARSGIVRGPAMHNGD